MPETGWVRYTPHALVATVVFEFMHIADEFAGNWAPFTPINEPTVAAISMGIFTFFGLWGLWWSLDERPWGYGLAALFGLFFGVAEVWHLVDSSNMTLFRWTVVLLAQACAAAVIALGASGLWRHKPWRRGRPSVPS